ncbi:RNA pseudouridine synthase [Shewanella sp. NFH-SH190041]|uniref:RluA family pseudouridine synthase n=1 Tax=Shewanella sp. NFH-SH190041 TaxID=2950245 RepID=UPI0021C36FDF|nr:pseudouridine synthase [Shewanella sp. NFH-SH190041]BDM63839.1 RNA pseudouridine synthase [Shewanella sp. NFH-SH190041]
MQIFDYHPPAIPWLDIRYVDDDMIVISKPSGLLSNPGRAAVTHDCALTRLQQRYPEAILVHRLDCATSGIMVFARHKQAESWLKTQFQDRLSEKVYIAEVSGHFPQAKGTINLPLLPDPDKRPLQKIDEKGKSAITDFRVLAHRPDSTLMQLTPHTGRTHQLRVHMLAMGHVILGDDFYGDANCIQARPRLCLHAQQLSIRHPKTQQLMVFTSSHPF